MKKIVLFIVIIIAIIICVITVKVSNNNMEVNDVSSYNATFEQYKGKTLYGADVLSIINKAIDINTQNNIKRDEDGYYEKNETNSVSVDIKLLSTDSKGEVKEVQYPMEVLEKAGLDTFISSFSLTTFECTEMKYNTAGRISKITLKQLEV